MKRTRKKAHDLALTLEDRIALVRGILSAVEVLARQDRHAAERALRYALAAEVRS